MTHEIVQQNISDLLERAGFGGDVTVSYNEKDHTLWFSLKAQNAHTLLAKDAEALLALNHLATKIADRLTGTEEKRLRVVLDANDFERRKIQNLQTLAHMMAERVRYFKSSLALDPMPPYERRIVHEFLAEMPDIATDSAGDGKDRHVVLRYVDPAI
jgi:spoIIIJ-associated protein